MSKKNQRKPRGLEVNIELHRNTSILLTGAPINVDGGLATNGVKIIFNPELAKNLDGNDNVITQRLFYNRDKSISKPKKIVTQIPIQGSTIIHNDIELFENYDFIFVMDTNCKPYNEKKVCLGMIGQLYINSDNDEISLHKLAHISFELDISCEDNPEKYTWLKFIEILISKIGSDKKIALVVDSELDSLTSYNNGNPILLDHKLPENMTFIYASADKTDTILNQAIIQCDKAATEGLKNMYPDL